MTTKQMSTQRFGKGPRRAAMMLAVAMLVTCTSRAPGVFGMSDLLGGTALAGSPGLAGRGLGADTVGGPGAMLPLILRTLDLREDQRAEIKEILATHRPRIGRLFIRLAAAQRDLAEHLYGPDQVSETSVDERIAEIQRIRTELMREGVAAVVEARRLLDEDQLAQMAGTSRRYRDLRAEMRQLFAPSPGGDGAAAAD